MEIKIIDSVMGSGKTTYMIDYMKKHQEEYNFIFITPFLSEIDRVIEAVPNFIQPKNTGKGKLESLKHLISWNKNICSTHSLFSYIDEDLINLFAHNNYILIMDEVFNVLEQLPMKRDDVKIFIEHGWFKINTDFTVEYTGDKEYKGDFKNIVEKIQSGKVIIDDEMKLLFWKFPVEVFKLFRDVYIITYMFDGQIMKYYYDIHNIKYKKFNVTGEYENYKLINYNSDSYKQYIKGNINILQNKKMNSIGTNKPSNLSKKWYIENVKKSAMKQLKNNLYNYYRNISKTASEEFLWTTFADYETKFQSRFEKNFLNCAARATNDYRHKKNLAYLINRYINPNIVKYFQLRNVKINQETYALSEMLQWIWRSAIRDGNDINIYIPSVRMRNLLENYLND